MKITSAEKLLFLVRQLFGKAAVRKCGLHLYPYTLAWPAPCRSRAAQKDDRSRKRAAAGSSSGRPGSTWPAVNSFGMKIVAESKHVECSGCAQAAARNRDSLGAHQQQQQHWPSVKMTRNIKNKSKLHIFGLNIIYEEHNGNLTLNCVLGRTKENKCNKNNSGKGYFCRDTFVFWAGRCLAPLSHFSIHLPSILHIFGNTNFGIFNEFQVVVSVIAIPLPALPPLSLFMLCQPAAYFCAFACALKSMQCLLCQPKSVPCPASWHACGCGHHFQCILACPPLPFLCSPCCTAHRAAVGHLAGVARN